MNSALPENRRRSPSRPHERGNDAGESEQGKDDEGEEREGRGEFALEGSDGNRYGIRHPENPDVHSHEVKASDPSSFFQTTARALERLLPSATSISMR